MDLLAQVALIACAIGVIAGITWSICDTSKKTNHEMVRQLLAEMPMTMTEIRKVSGLNRLKTVDAVMYLTENGEIYAQKSKSPPFVTVYYLKQKVSTEATNDNVIALQVNN